MIYTVTLNPAIDCVFGLDTLTPGALNRARSAGYAVGGKGINVSIVLQRLGLPSTALGFIAGRTGEIIERGVRDEGVQCDFIRGEQGLSRINVKLLAAEETEINGCGPAVGERECAQLLEQLQRLQADDTLLLAGSLPDGMPQDIYERAAATAAERGAQLVVDTGGRQLRRLLQYRPFLIKPNLSELCELVGRPLEGEREIAEAAAALRALGARNLLVSLGGDGALLFDEDGREHRAAAHSGRVVSTVGAGDSMVAGFLAGYIRNSDYGSALRLGTAAGGAAAFSETLPAREAIAALLGERL